MNDIAASGLKVDSAIVVSKDTGSNPGCAGHFDGKRSFAAPGSLPRRFCWALRWLLAVPSLMVKVSASICFARRILDPRMFQTCNKRNTKYAR